MIVDDFSVRHARNATIEDFAREWRDRLNSFFVSNQLDVVDFLESAGRLLKRPVSVVIQVDSKMGRANAYVSSDRRVVFVRSSLAREAKAGNPDAIFAAVHELGHLVLHPEGAPLARMVDGNAKQGFIIPEESAEHQANYFARAFLMNAEEIDRYSTPEAISEFCYTPLKQAEIRVAEFRRLPSTPQQLPSAGQETSRVRKAWESARKSPDHDPFFFRLSRGGFLAEKKRIHDPRHHFGWFEDHGSVVTYFEHTTD